MLSQTEKQRRSKERYVYEASNLVQHWRDLFENGYTDSAGYHIMPTLKQAAQIVGCSKKTLEDYYSIIRKASQLIDIKLCFHQKMGYLRQLLKKECCLNVAAPETTNKEEESPNNDSWNNMLIEAEEENSKNEFDVDQYLVQGSKLYPENEYTEVFSGDENWKAIQIDEEEINPAQPQADWSFEEF